MELRLKIPAEKALEIIAAYTDRAIWFSGHTCDTKPFIGRVKENRFYLYRKHERREAFIAVLYGQVEATEYGCEIRAQFNACKGFMIVWLSMAAVALLFGLGVCAKGMLTNSLGLEVFMAIGIPLCMLTFGFFFFRNGMEFNQYDREKLEKEFVSLFDSVCHCADE